MKCRLLAAAYVLLSPLFAVGQTTNQQSWTNPTAATSGTAQPSPILNLCGQGWEGSVPTNTQVCLSLQNLVGNGPNGNGFLTLSGTGSTGSYAFAAPSFVAQGTAAGALSLSQGTGPIFIPPNSFTLLAPPGITNAFEVVTPASASTGFWLGILATAATATATVTGGVVTALTVTGHGSGYGTAPVCQISGGEEVLARPAQQRSAGARSAVCRSLLEGQDMAVRR